MLNSWNQKPKELIMKKTTVFQLVFTILCLVLAACQSQNPVTAIHGNTGVINISPNQDNRGTEYAATNNHTGHSDAIKPSKNDDVELMPKNEPDKEPKTIAGQIVYDSNRGIWRRQIILSNGATENDVTDKMKEYIRNIPTTNAQVNNTWKPYIYKIMATNGRILPEFK